MVDSTRRRRAGVPDQQPQRRRGARTDGAAAARQGADSGVRLRRGRTAVAASRAAAAAEVSVGGPLPLACVCAATRLAARVLTAVYDRELRATGVQTPQFALLSVLTKRPQAAQQELGTWLAMEQSTLSRNLRGLARKGWVS